MMPVPEAAMELTAGAPVSRVKAMLVAPLALPAASVAVTVGEGERGRARAAAVGGGGAVAEGQGRRAGDGQRLGGVDGEGHHLAGIERAGAAGDAGAGRRDGGNGGC